MPIQNEEKDRLYAGKLLKGGAVSVGKLIKERAPIF